MTDQLTFDVAERSEGGGGGRALRRATVRAPASIGDDALARAALRALEIPVSSLQSLTVYSSGEMDVTADGGRRVFVGMGVPEEE